MNRNVFALVLLSVLMSAVAQLVLKAGMSSASVAQGLSGANKWQAAQTVGSNPWVLGGLALYFLSAVVWLLVLARVDVSIAYPLVGIGFVVTMFLAWMFHGEPITLAKVVGTSLIALGVFVLARH